MRGRDHDPVRPGTCPGRVVRQDRPGHRRSRRVPATRVNQHADTVRGQHLQRGHLGRLGQGVRVGAQVQRAVDALGRPVLADRLGGGQDVVLVERGRERGPAMTGGAERHPLHGIPRIGVHRVVGGDQLRDVDQILSSSGLSRTSIDHVVILTREAAGKHPGAGRSALLVIGSGGRGPGCGLRSRRTNQVAKTWNSQRPYLIG